MGKSSYLCSWKTLRFWSMQDSEMRQSRAGLHRIGNWRDTFHYCSLEKAVRGRWKEWNTKQKLPLSSWWWQNILSFLWWGPEGETKVKQRVKKGSRSGGACRVGSRDGLRRLPEQRERPGSPCWNTEVREKSSRVLTLATSVATPVSQACAFSQSTCQYGTGLGRNYSHLLDFLTFRASSASMCGRKH